MTVTLVHGVWLAYKTLEGFTGIGLTIFDAVKDLAETERLANSTESMTFYLS